MMQRHPFDPLTPLFPMPVHVEFFGIPRSRTGVELTVAEGRTLGDVILALTDQFPALADTCFAGRTLRSGFTANVNGDRFATAPDTVLHDGDTILLMSLDAGG